jgi:mevalonate kinase
MDSFFVSAPGKVILFGEHAVVHEKVWIPISAFAQHSSLSCKRLASMETDL